MTINAGLYAYDPSLSLKYVLVLEKEAMLSSHKITKENIFEDCLEDCGEPPPPEFYLPPPPCPPDLGFGDDSWTCPAMIPKGYRPNEEAKISIAVVVVTAATFVLLAIVAALIIYRRRRYHASQDTKGIPPVMGSAIIYDDLTPQIIQRHSRPSSIASRSTRQSFWAPLLTSSPPRYVPPSSLNCGNRGQHMQTALEGDITPGVTEPLYHTISSGSGSGSSCHYPEEGVILSRSPPGQRSPLSDTEEEDSMTPFLKKGDVVAAEDTDSAQGANYYLSVPVSKYFPPSAPSSLQYETLPLRGTHLSHNNLRGSPTPQEKGLPPLPSRSERFRMFLPPNRDSTSKPTRNKCPREIAYQRPPVANPVLYENVGLSSHL